MKNHCLHKIKKFIKGSPEDWKQMGRRQILKNQSDPSLPNNRITTSKYTFVTFIPINLYEQFTKMANVYFLTVGILQMIPAISITNGLPTEWTALIVIVILTAIKDLIEDLQRHKADRRENEQLIESQFGDIKSMNLRVGDIVRIYPYQHIPADILLLEKGCLIETSQLDGESNLKAKFPIIGEFNCISAEGPTPYLYHFEGNVDEEKSIDEQNLILRGCTLKSQESILGIVLYTGHQTKIMLNQHNPRGKSTHMQKIMNKLIIYLFLAQWVLCAFCAMMYIIEGGQVNYMISIGNWFLIFVNFVPISLMLTLEMIRFMQAQIMVYDEEMQPKMRVQASNLNDDLGQINQIFSDKTGTLTQNKMTLKSIYIDKYIEYEDDLIIKSKNTEILLMMLAFCNDITIHNDQYLTQSPDELAFINYLLTKKYKLTQNNDHNFILTNSNTLSQSSFNITKLHILQFDSVRKRMSVILQYNESIYVFIKGADSVIFNRSNQNTPAEDAIKYYSHKGYRTLVFGYKEINQQELLQFTNQLKQFKLSGQDTQHLIDQMETNFEIIAVTGVEDKLQDDVPHTINLLAEANIQVWIITGDHIGTALSVANTSKLVTYGDKPFVLAEDNMQFIEEQLLQLKEQKAITWNNLIEACIIIPGHILMHFQLEQKLQLIQMAKKCKGVVFCRVSPKQKREVVELYKKCFPNDITLAIGDGANDVNMITEAHVGIGMQGEEGMQAARASDYAIPQFKCLVQLLLYYGRECYRKNCYVVLYNFYKNVLYLIPQFWFGFYNQFSAQSIYDFYVFQCFNFMFTSLPILVYGVMDVKYLDTNPQYYHSGQQNQYLNHKMFWLIVLKGTYQSAIIYYFTFYGLNVNLPYEEGLLLQGQIVFLICVIVANCDIILMSHQLQLLQLITQALSFLSYFITLIITNYMSNYMLYLILNQMMVQIDVYLIVLLSTITAISVQFSLERVLPEKSMIFKRTSKSSSISMQDQILNTNLLQQ